MMRKFLACILVATSFSCASNAQTVKQPPLPNYSLGNALWGQMVNVSNTHPLQTKDTTRTTTSVYQYIGKWGASNLPTTYAPVGFGTLTYTAAVYHASTVSTVNPTVTITAEESIDGITYAPVPGVTVVTVTATSPTTAATAAINLTALPAPFNRLKFTPASDTISVTSNWFLNYNATR